MLRAAFLIYNPNHTHRPSYHSLYIYIFKETTKRVFIYKYFKVNVQGGSIIGWISDLVGLKTLGKLSNSRVRLRTLLCFGSGERQRPSSYREKNKAAELICWLHQKDCPVSMYKEQL